LPSAGLTPGVEDVVAIVEILQVGVGGAHHPEILTCCAVLHKQSRYCHPL
jgi:hypothetical protein